MLTFREQSVPAETVCTFSNSELMFMIIEVNGCFGRITCAQFEVQAALFICCVTLVIWSLCRRG